MPRPQGPRFDVGIYELGTQDCDPDPNVTAYPGSSCDDGNPLTINDVYDDNCNCAGEPGPCINIGDNDGDGVCSDVDCDDNNAGISYQVGDACDDGDPNTTGDVIQGDCTCAGIITGPLTACSRVSASNDDAEERASGDISLTSSDLEMSNDPSNGDQTVGMRFNGLNIPQGATIVSAYIQFATDETNNVNPCQLIIYGQDSDDALTFTNNDFDITNRPRTSASVTWEPADWLIRGYAGDDERTPDISAVIQEIVNRSGYAVGSSIAIIIDGTGQRTAEAFDGSPATAPELCVEYETGPDCPALDANIGDACDDGDPTTTDDVIGSDCNCAGTPTACHGIGDADGDGVCANFDCNDNDPAITTQHGDASDDSNNNTY
ncbi:MAG: hypothetical protein KDD10_09240, partial [Phaeodactylibacter sp.]|nr:hypothetical protein [Phaeodactylibacter sp.]